MPKEESSGKKSTSRRYSTEEKAAAVRMVRALRAELGTEQGTVARVAGQLGYGVDRLPVKLVQPHHVVRVGALGRIICNHISHSALFFSSGVTPFKLQTRYSTRHPLHSGAGICCGLEMPEG